MGGGVDDRAVPWHEVGARGAAQSCADRCRRCLGRGAVLDVHDVDLVAIDSPARIGGLEDEVLSVKGPVGLGVVSSVRQLPDVLKVNFFFVAAVETVGEVCDGGFWSISAGLGLRSLKG